MNAPLASEILNAFLFGDKTNISEELYFIFQQTGLVHLLCASGFHMTLIIGNTQLILDQFLKLYLNKKNKLALREIYFLHLTRLCLLLGIGIYYAALCQWSMSITRALLQIFIWKLGKLIFFEAKPLWLFCLTVFAASLLGQGSYLSLLLSATAVASYLFCLDSSLPWWQKLMLSSVAPWLATAPILVWQFHHLSFLSPLINIVFTPILSYGVILPGIIAELCKLTEAQELALSLFQICLVPLQWIAFSLPSAVFTNSISYGIPAVIALLLTKKPTLMIAPFLLWYSVTPNVNYEVAVLDVGQGDSILFRSKNKQTCLLDFGRDAKRPYTSLASRRLAGLGVNTINCLILSHPDRDHYGGVHSILLRHEIDGAAYISHQALYYKNVFYLLRELERASIPVVILNNDLHWRNQLQCQVSLQAATNSNNSSLFCLFQMKRGQTMLFTGDANESSELQFISQNNKLISSPLTYLKVGHHGSRYSTNSLFLRDLHPQEAFISVGRNWYGHPHPDTLKRLEQLNIKVRRTDQEGTILLPTAP